MFPVSIFSLIIVTLQNVADVGGATAADRTGSLYDELLAAAEDMCSVKSNNRPIDDNYHGWYGGQQLRHWQQHCMCMFLQQTVVDLTLVQRSVYCSVLLKLVAAAATATTVLCWSPNTVPWPTVPAGAFVLRMQLAVRITHSAYRATQVSDPYLFYRKNL
jgi:hypothetical protein